MELSCESFRHPEERRAKSGKFVELHVLYVPDGHWDVKLNKLPAEAIQSFISAGFIRAYPEITLRTLRGELRVLLGTEIMEEKFSFLKCVGRSLALVKNKQERDLKVKTFAPPYAPQPELYLLPTVEHSSSVCSQSLCSETRCSSPEHQTYDPRKTCSLPAGTKEPLRFPMIPQGSQQSPPPPLPSPDEEEDEEEREEDEGSYSSTDGEELGGGEAPSSGQPHWTHKGSHSRRPRNHVTSQIKGVDSAQVKELPVKAEISGWRKQINRRSRAARDSGLPESVEDGHSGFSQTQNRMRNSIDTERQTETRTFVRNKPNEMVLENSSKSSRPMQCVSQGRVPNQALAQREDTNRDELMEEIKLVREKRKELEWTRQELLRKGKDLLAQNRHRRNQARDGWKKKYFETKKATAPLEDTLRSLRQEVETFYNKLLHQLQARDGRGKPRRPGRSSTKNELIIQIMTESHETDNLRRQVEDARMKLVTEIKLRKQAATELRALKAELAQKKSQTTHCGPITSLCFGLVTRDRTQAQNTGK